MTVIDPAVLLTSVLSGDQRDLDFAEYTALKAHLGPALDALKDLDSKLSEQKKATEIGQKFRFRGQQFLVMRHGSTTAWKKAFDIAFDMLTKTKQNVVKTAVEDLKTDTKKVKEVH